MRYYFFFRGQKKIESKNSISCENFLFCFISNTGKKIPSNIPLESHQKNQRSLLRNRIFIGKKETLILIERVCECARERGVRRRRRRAAVYYESAVQAESYIIM